MTSASSIWSITHVTANTVRPPFTTLTTRGSPIAPLAHKHNVISLFHVMYLPLFSCPIHKVFMWIGTEIRFVSDTRFFPWWLSNAPVSPNPRKCCCYSGRGCLDCMSRSEYQWVSETSHCFAKIAVRSFALHTRTCHVGFIWYLITDYVPQS